MMDDELRALLLEVAGYLRLIERGFPASPAEATHILAKVGRAIDAGTPPEDTTP